MSETRKSGETTEREEVAPGLVMEITQTHEPDGRYLLYYNFTTVPESCSEAGAANTAAASPSRSPDKR
jgi:hypothetical protein